MLKFTIMRAISKVVFLLLIGLSLTECIKRDEFSNIPEIEYEDFILYQNMEADLIFNFTDGDGDIGLSSKDNEPPFDTGSDHYYNFYMEYFAKRDGVFEKIDPVIPFYYRIPDLRSEAKKKALQGKITVQLSNIFPITLDYDTIKFNFYLEDRALNKSNIETTPEIIRPQ